ncbi:hypothetical protein ASC97_29095 [Rhizobium sp. Root1203]|uniref:hypothetical protein n=1 Tax=Rhizobium sp. Root1203 TaxID=1736427 RepID=UPI00070CB14B|nr:hypothetical protein [Rhizobium sp. Root1203]KQV19729.1 hypothetical protein ASC97_29095 [Rhizobium sp. Root1203]
MPESQTYDGVYVYLTNVAAFRPGDVVLTQNRHTRSAAALREAELIAARSGGDFSHVLICAETPAFIEALADGVGAVTFQASFCHDLENVQVLRYHNEDIARTAADWAVHFHGQRYSVRKARSAISGTDVDFRDDDGTFCSAFVAEAYLNAGAREFEGTSALKYTPASFERIGGFQVITPTVFERDLAPLNAETMTALDGDRASSPARDQRVLYRNFIESVATDLDALFSSGDESRPQTFYKCLEYLRRSFQHGHGPQSEDLTRLDDHLHEAMTDGRLDLMFKEISAKDEPAIQRIIIESFERDPDFDLQDLRRMREATLKQIEERSAALGSASQRASASKSWNRWLQLSLNVIRQLELRNFALGEVLSRVEAC